MSEPYKKVDSSKLHELIDKMNNAQAARVKFEHTHSPVNIHWARERNRLAQEFEAAKSTLITYLAGTRELRR